MAIELGRKPIPEAVSTADKAHTPTHYLIEAKRSVQACVNGVRTKAEAHPKIPIIITVALVVLSPIIYDLANDLG